MKHSQRLVVIAAMILGIAGFAFAQQAARAQPETRQPALQSDRNAQHTQLMACACSHMEGGVMACNRAVAPGAAKEKHASQSTNKGASATWEKGDPNASQNRVEYGGPG
jgi:uncharacterized protein HemX